MSCYNATVIQRVTGAQMNTPVVGTGGGFWRGGGQTGRRHARGTPHQDLGRWLAFAKGAETIQWIKIRFLSKRCRDSGAHIIARKTSLRPKLAPYGNINSKWVTGVHGRCETAHLLEINVGEDTSAWVRPMFLKCKTKA